MTIRLCPDAYGEQTEELQRIISEAEGMSIFLPAAHGLEEKAVVALTEAHMAGLAAEGFDRPATLHVRLLRGGADVLARLWSTGAAWREMLGRLIGRLHERHGRAGAGRLVPPLWPTGVINVFGVVLVATEDGWARCARVGGNADYRDTCWECMCFVEAVVDGLLVAALFNDRAAAVFAPLLALLRAGWMPLGYEHGCFTCLQYGA